MAKRPAPGPDLDDIDADLRASDDEIAAALAEVAPRDGERGGGARGHTSPSGVGDELDLHTFAPRECASVVDEYLRTAHAAGLAMVRVVHGKGTGALRRTVHAVLARHPLVREYRLADERSGSWGATWVALRPRDG